jgi:hypothetical protein
MLLLLSDAGTVTDDDGLLVELVVSRVKTHPAPELGTVIDHCPAHSHVGASNEETEADS